VGEAFDHAREREELGKIDYLLDQLARAVERGEVARASYDAMAPRYLARRADLASILTVRPVAGHPEQQSVEDKLELVFESRRTPGETGFTGPAPAEQTVVLGQAEAEWHKPMSQVASAAGDRPARVAPRSAPVSVNWTSVLLFLGAFLVISASAIFALTVWGSVGTLGKLAFMGTATLCFYIAGYFARTRLNLMAGSTALTAVGSAMLLFDCWIVIDGFSLTGPMPWAVALLVVSGVYWLSEVTLGQRIYGVAGAAAQVAWWWLAADALHLDPMVRIAVIAVVGVVWQLLAARGVENEPVRSLSEVLLWAAPVVEALAALGTAAAVLAYGPTNAVMVAAATVTAAAGAVVVLRSRFVVSPADAWIAAALQLPLFAAVLYGGGPSWAGVAFLLALTAAYLLAAVARYGVPMTLLSAAAEVLAVSSILDLLHVGPHGLIAVMAVLGLSWVAASRLLGTVGREPSSPWLSSAQDTALALGLLGFAPLLWASVSALFMGDGPALLGGTTVAADVVTVAIVLVAWSGASLLRRHPLPAAGTIAWSFYTLAALMAWALPGRHSAYYAAALVVLAAIWLFTRYPVQRFYRLDLAVLGWSMRGAMLLFGALGLVAEVYYFSQLTSWASLFLTVTVSIMFFADALIAEEPTSAAVGGVALVLAGDLLGHLVWSGGAGAVAAAAVAVLVAAAAWGFRGVWRDRSWALAIAVALAATIACLAGVPEWWLAGALALTAVAWAVATATSWEPLALPSGLVALAALCALLSAADRPSWVTIAAFGVAAVLLGLPSVLPAARCGAAHQQAGAAVAAAGGVGLAGLVAVGYVGRLIGMSGWLDLGPQGLAAALLLLGGYVVVQAVMWRLEPLLYAGCLFWLFALFAELGARNFTTAELFSTPLALYLVAMGYLYTMWDRESERRYPAQLDLLSVVVGLGVPVCLALTNTFGKPMIVHTSWAIGLSLFAIAAGVLVRSRYFLFGGAAALALVAGWRTMSYLAQLWWLVLGVIGVALLVIALTWERQRQFIGATRMRLERSFEDWR